MEAPISPRPKCNLPVHTSQSHILATIEALRQQNQMLEGQLLDMDIQMIGMINGKTAGVIQKEMAKNNDEIKAWEDSLNSLDADPNSASCVNQMIATKDMYETMYQLKRATDRKRVLDAINNYGNASSSTIAELLEIDIVITQLTDIMITTYPIMMDIDFPGNYYTMTEQDIINKMNKLSEQLGTNARQFSDPVDPEKLIDINATHFSDPVDPEKIGAIASRFSDPVDPEKIGAVALRHIEADESLK